MKKAKFIHLISLLLTLYMILGILPMSVFAATGSDITVEETQSSDASETANISNAQNENVGIEVLSDIQSGNNSDVATIASTSPTTKYFSIDSTNCHLKYS